MRRENYLQSLTLGALSSLLLLFFCCEFIPKKEQNLNCVLDFNEESARLSDSLFYIKKVVAIPVDSLKHSETIEIQPDSLSSQFAFQTMDRIGLSELRNSTLDLDIIIYAEHKDYMGERMPIMFYYHESIEMERESIVILKPEFY